jgi:hypothetical protein
MNYKIFLLFLLTSNVLFSQSKKEQIFLQGIKIDSLEKLLEKNKLNFDLISKSLNNKIDSLISLNVDLQKLNSKKMKILNFNLIK